MIDPHRNIFQIRREIMSVKRIAKRQWGARSDWPDFIRARYEDLKDQARRCQQEMEPAHG